MKVTFFISSVISCSNKKLSYSNTRSVFTINERIEQTKKTVLSIRTMVPNARIVFVEMGNTNEYSSNILPIVDTYVFVGNKRLVRFFVNSQYKGLGEVVGLLYAKKQIINDTSDIYIKISGRYYLTSQFLLSNLSLERLSFLKRGNTVSTRLFSFPKKFFRYWVHIYLMSVPLLFLGITLERVIFLVMRRSKIIFLEHLGVAGFIAPTGEFISE